MREFLTKFLPPLNLSGQEQDYSRALATSSEPSPPLWVLSMVLFPYTVLPVLTLTRSICLLVQTARTFIGGEHYLATGTRVRIASAYLAYRVQDAFRFSAPSNGTNHNRSIRHASPSGANMSQ